MPLGHQGDHQLALAERIHDSLGFRRRTSLHWKAPCLGGGRDQRVVGATFAAPVAVLIGPLGHLDGIDNASCQGGYHDGHGGGAAAVTADVVGAIGFVGIAFIVLIEVDHLHSAVCEMDTAQGGDHVSGGGLEHPIPEEQAEVLSIVLGQFLLLVGQVEDLISKVVLPLVDDGIDVPDLGSTLVCLRLRIIRDSPGLAGA